MAEMAAFDNVNELAGVADDWVLAKGRQATGQFLRMQGDGDVGETIEMPDGGELRRLPETHRRASDNQTARS